MSDWRTWPVPDQLQYCAAKQEWPHRHEILGEGKYEGMTRRARFEKQWGRTIEAARDDYNERRGDGRGADDQAREVPAQQ